MPFKANAARRHHIPKQKHRVTNWAEYDAGLRARGSLTVWFTPEAVEAWKAEPRTGRGRQPSYSALAIATALTLRAVFRLALRQTEGLIAFHADGPAQQKPGLEQIRAVARAPEQNKIVRRRQYAKVLSKRVSRGIGGMRTMSSPKICVASRIKLLWHQDYMWHRWRLRPRMCPDNRPPDRSPSLRSQGCRPLRAVACAGLNGALQFVAELRQTVKPSLDVRKPGAGHGMDLGAVADGAVGEGEQSTDLVEWDAEFAGSPNEF
ncbi:Transposase DDE domain-containing protein [Belnapia rosea]|nr:Transposase DDE domain-containing protein [Belnapia rosea]